MMLYRMYLLRISLISFLRLPHHLSPPFPTNAEGKKIRPKYKSIVRVRIRDSCFPPVAELTGTEYRVRKFLQQLTRSKAAAKIDASGIVPGSQQFNRNWKRFMPCRIAPRFTTFLLFPPSWLEGRWSSKLWQPVDVFPCWKKEGERV